MTKDVNETVFSALPFLQKNSSFDFASIPFLLKKIQGAQFILIFFYQMIIFLLIFLYVQLFSLF